MGRKPLPDDQKKERVVLYLTATQQEKLDGFLREHLSILGGTVRLPVMPLDDEAFTMSQVRFEADLTKQPVHGIFGSSGGEDIYVPSMRECGICGKDYDGNVHDSCPHVHEPNGKRK